MTSARTTNLLLGCLLTVAPAAPLAAQGGTPQIGRVIQGIVYDSVAARPLTGASVQLAERDGASVPRIVSSDSAGRYRFVGVSAGQYVLGFYHEVLTTLGLDAPTRAVEVTTDADVRAELAVPSSETIRVLRCDTSSQLASGMLVGFVRDAETRAAIAGTKATVHWRAFALDSANYRVVEERMPATITNDGMLLVCHLPIDVPLDLLVTAPGHRNVEGTVITVPPGGIARVDLLLADASSTSGTAVIRGRVTRMSGKVVESGRVIIKALGREVAVRNGEFVAADMPAGSWVAEARIIGVEPQDVLVTAMEYAVATANIIVSNGPQRLDAVTVVGRMDRDLRVLEEVLRRKRIGMGTTFLPGHPALRSAHFVSDVMREARGFLYQGPNKILGRQHGRDRCSNIAVYVDDVRQPDSFESLDHAASIKEVLAIETWPDIAMAPVQYRRAVPGTQDIGPPRAKYSRRSMPEPPPCALVLIWTRRSF